MNEMETKIAEARVEANLQAFLAHADDFSKGFRQGVLTLLNMCRVQSNMHNTYILDLVDAHQHHRVSQILREFQTKGNNGKSK